MRRHEIFGAVILAPVMLLTFPLLLFAVAIRGGIDWWSRIFERLGEKEP